MTPPPLFLSPRLKGIPSHDAVGWWAWPQAVLDVALKDHPVGLCESEGLVVGDQSVAIRDEPVRKFELGLVLGEIDLNIFCELTQKKQNNHSTKRIGQLNSQQKFLILILKALVESIDLVCNHAKKGVQPIP